VQQQQNGHQFISIITWALPLGLALQVVEQELELGTLGQARRIFLKEALEQKIVETVKMIRKVFISTL
jgi:hypothetical protein